MLCHLFNKKNITVVLPVLKQCLLILLLMGLCIWFQFPCIFYKITAIPCPTCKMTRALLSLLKGDIRAYATYNVMALPVAIVFVGQIWNTCYGKYKKCFHYYTIIILTINLFYYFARLLNI